MSVFRDFLFANRESMYLVAVLALNLISVCLIPAIYYRAEGALTRRTRDGWPPSLAAFNLLLVRSLAISRAPTSRNATIAFCATALLVLAAHRVGGWKLLIAATVLSALTVGSLQSGILIIAPFMLAQVSRLFHGGKCHYRELTNAPTARAVWRYSHRSLLSALPGP